jgi:dihydrofolate reductase
MNMIVAYCKNRGIGIGNTLPWHIKNELKHFKDLTTANKNDCIIMGKNTWLSLPKKPLPNRTNIILSSSLKKEALPKETLLFNNKEALMNHISQQNYTPWVIGGEKIYKTFISSNNLNNIYVTFIDEKYDCDTFFPKIPKNFKLIQKTEYQMTNKIFYRYEIYKKI